MHGGGKKGTNKPFPSVPVLLDVSKREGLLSRPIIVLYGRLPKWHPWKEIFERGKIKTINDLVQKDASKLRIGLQLEPRLVYYIQKGLEKIGLSLVHNPVRSGTPIEKLNFEGMSARSRARAINSLKKAGIYTAEEVLSLDYANLVTIPGIGAKTHKTAIRESKAGTK